MVLSAGRWLRLQVLQGRMIQAHHLSPSWVAAIVHLDEMNGHFAAWHVVVERQSGKVGHALSTHQKANPSRRQIITAHRRQRDVRNRALNC